MSISIFKIEGQELQDFVNKVTKDPNVTLMMEKLIEQKVIASTDYKVADAFKGELEGTQISVAVLKMGNNVKINIYETNGQLQIVAIILEKEDGQEVFKELRIVNQHLEAVNIIPCTEKHKEVAQKIKEQELNILSGNLQDNPTTAIRVPCIYGNWCGPGCSGPDAPIDEVDRCCMYHDRCYGENGYFNCDCDREIIICLLPYYYMGDFWATVVFNYMMIQYDLHC